jgi:hypothetical protein
MPSLENKPPSTAKRPGGSLAIDTSSQKSKAKASSPPRTPQKSSSRMGKSNAAAHSRALRERTNPRETFLDDFTPIDGPRHRRPSETMSSDRDSHGLTLSAQQGTRDSLVDHMLLSFDQLAVANNAGACGGAGRTSPGAAQYNAFGDEEVYTSYVGNNTTSAGGHGYSYSSDYESQQTMRPESQATRERRSNSSSAFQNGLVKLNSITPTTAPVARQGPPTPSRGLHSRGGKGSKGSSVDGLDLGYAQITQTQRWGHRIGGRSSSFDFGHDRQSVQQQITPVTAQFAPYDYDSAPTPTVPSGPRREMSMMPSPQLPFSEIMPAPPIPKTIERKRSTRSSKSAYRAPSSHNPSGVSFLHGSADKVPQLPSMPAFVTETAAPAPSIGYGKNKDNLPAPSKPGFFRRVFGSSKNTPMQVAGANFMRGSTTSIDHTNRPPSKTQYGSVSNVPPTRDAPPTPQKDQSHVVTKKPSSFFRRRKKSVSEPERPPPLPLHLTVAKLPLQSFSNREDLVHDDLPSPVGSLTQVMNPYLEETLQNPNGLSGNKTYFDSSIDDNDVRSFSPDYNPDLNATIRTIKPTTREGYSEDTRDLQDQNKYHPEVKASSSFLRPATPTRQQTSDTFYQDSSDNERHSSKSRETSEKRERSPIRSESVARDRALVAEYERKQSSRSKPMPPPALELTKVYSNGSSVSAPTKIEPKEDDLVMVTPSKATTIEIEHDQHASTPSEADQMVTTELLLPSEISKDSAPQSGSTGTEYKSAKSTPVVEHELHDSPAPLSAVTHLPVPDEILVSTPIDDEPTEGDRERAKKIFEGNGDFIQNSKAAAWMGDDGDIRRRTLKAYLELFDFANVNILAALRQLCGKLTLKAESQQVDRILDAFAKRWCECNPNHGFKATDVVHTICYSVLLLNTDLHMADIESKMTKTQFVKNTLPTIMRVVADAAPGAFEPTSARPTILPTDNGTLLSPLFYPPKNMSTDDLPKASAADKQSWRASFRPPPRSNSDERSVTLNHGGPADDCGPLIKASFTGSRRAWEFQIESILKEFYNSIRMERLPLFGAADDEPPQADASLGKLSVMANNVLRRSPSVLSRATSEAPGTSGPGSRGRPAEHPRPATGRYSSKNRSRPRLYGGSTMGSSRTSLDDGSSMWSPSVHSSTWSKYSLGKTQTSMSVNSLGSDWGHGDYQSSIGFANALSQAIIREDAIAGAGRESATSRDDDLRAAPLLEDESLSLCGAPWAKEGLLKHKHHFEAAEKRAKDRNWSEVFAVIEKGYMTLFSFSAKSMRNKAKSKGPSGTMVVGGGNWQDNAEMQYSFVLRQTIASALPPPGYSKQRPHVWALSLPTGAVHLFQVGTPEIVKEFVSTANYWSARLSNHPLVGGISNIEYGWSEGILNSVAGGLTQTMTQDSTSNTTIGHRPSTSGPRPSMQSSLRSSFDHGPGGSFRAKLPGDKVTIVDWTPPQQSMRQSNLMELDQLNALTAYVKGIEDELQIHNQLRSQMLLAVSPFFPSLSSDKVTQNELVIDKRCSSPPATPTLKRRWPIGRRSRVIS